MRNIIKALLAATFSVASLACVDVSAPPQKVLPKEDILKRIHVSPTAVVMAVGDSLQASASAENLLGDILSIPVDNPITWSTGERDLATVDSTGKIKAVASTGEQFVSIYARWSHNGYTDSTEVMVNITPTRAELTSIRISPKDSTRTAWDPDLDIFSLSSLSVMAYQDGNTQWGRVRVPVTFDPSYSFNDVWLAYFGTVLAALGVEPYVIMSNIIGDYWLYAKANVYGVDMEDSIKMTGLYPAAVSIKVSVDSFSSSVITTHTGTIAKVQPCAKVKFINDTQKPVAVEFSDPLKADGCVAGDPAGNIASISPGQTVFRKFSSTGLIQWSLRNPDTGAPMPNVNGTISVLTPE